MAVIQYFAYGSNMMTERLQARCLSARARGVARADNHALAFCKKSQDGSGKATLSSCSDDGCRVFGVVFDLDESQLPELDRFEGAGKGYDRIDCFQVHMAGSPEPLGAVTYIANPGYIDLNLKPYDWYLNLVIAGARQHFLPLDYLATLEAILSVRDPKPDRKSRHEALRLLGENLE